MNISKINNFKNFTFGEIHVNKDNKMTSKQADVEASVIRKLEESADKFKNKTAGDCYKEKSKHENIFTRSALIVLSTFLLVTAAAGSRSKHSPKIKNTKQLIESVDSISTSSKSIMHDTIRL